MNKITEVVEREVNFLEDVDVEWISIVDHGANRSPFKVIKSGSCKEEGSQMYDVIQSIIIPKDEDIEELKKKCDWLNGIPIAKVDAFDSYVKHTHIQLDKFDQDSMRLSKLPDTETVVITGNLLEADPNAVSVRKDEKIKSAGYVESFCNMAYNGLYALVQSIQGTLELRELPNENKKSAISNCLSAFQTFISAGLDNASDLIVAKVDVLKKESEVIMDKVEKTVEISDEKVELTFNAEEAISELNKKLEGVVEKFATSPNMNESVPGPNDTNQVPQVPGGTDESAMFGANTGAGAVIAAISKLTEMVEKLSERLDKMDSVVSESAASNEPVEFVQKSDGKDPFRGIIFGK